MLSEERFRSRSITVVGSSFRRAARASGAPPAPRIPTGRRAETRPRCFRQNSNKRIAADGNPIAARGRPRHPIHHRGRIIRPACFSIVAGLRHVRVPVSSQIGENNAVARGQRIRHRQPKNSWVAGNGCKRIQAGPSPSTLIDDFRVRGLLNFLERRWAHCLRFNHRDAERCRGLIMHSSCVGRPRAPSVAKVPPG